MANQIFGKGLRAIPLVLVQSPVSKPGDPEYPNKVLTGQPVYIQGLGNVTATQGVAVANVSAANATDLATAQTLANANKVAINALLASLRTASVIAP